MIWPDGIRHPFGPSAAGSGDTRLFCDVVVMAGARAFIYLGSPTRLPGAPLRVTVAD